MRVILLLISTSFILTGCFTSVSYIAESGDRIAYTRVGNQKLQNLSFDKKDEDIKVSVESTETQETESMKRAADALANATE